MFTVRVFSVSLVWYFIFRKPVIYGCFWNGIANMAISGLGSGTTIHPMVVWSVGLKPCGNNGIVPRAEHVGTLTDYVSHFSFCGCSSGFFVKCFNNFYNLGLGVFKSSLFTAFYRTIWRPDSSVHLTACCIAALFSRIFWVSLIINDCRTRSRAIVVFGNCSFCFVKQLSAQAIFAD